MFNPIKEPFCFTIFGASGDLAKLKIFPAIFALAKQNRLPDDFIIVGFARTPKSREKFQKEFSESVSRACQKDDFPTDLCKKTVDMLLSRVFYFSGKYDNPSDFERFSEFLHSISPEAARNHIAYFSIPPSLFALVAENLSSIRPKDGNLKIVLEKPFGENQASAEKLFHFLSRFYDPSDIFLLDHYLGKTAVQSILHLRHNNAVLNMLLKGTHIAQIQITAHEEVGIEERIGYFDQVGIVKDMFQSHITQILAMVAMSIPVHLDSASFQREKYAILSALDFSPRAKNVFLGQYETYPVSGSTTETYFSAKLKIDRESWYGVPIFVRMGKKMKMKKTTVVVEFKKLPFQKESEPNRLIFELQPREMIHLKLLNQYGQSSEFHEIAATESIACRGDDCLPEHSLLFLDILRGERLHFLSFPEILASWRITDRICEFLHSEKIQPESYPAGVSSPVGSDRIFKEIEDQWFEVNS